MAATKLTNKIILKMLKDRSIDIKKRFKVRKLGLFGSYAVNKAKNRSDIDILVEFDQPTFDNYMDLKFYLEDLFKTKVDLVMMDTLKPAIKSRILEEVQLVSGI